MDPWVTCVDSPLGPLFALSRAEGLVALGFGEAPAGPPGDPHGVGPALRRSFAGELHALDALPVRTYGTAFQERVWAAMRRIPPGQTLRYAELARACGSVARAVGGASGANPVAIVAPCHRVLGARGDLVGYGGGLHRKRWLLQHEGVPLQGEPRPLFE